MNLKLITVELLVGTTAGFPPQRIPKPNSGLIEALVQKGGFQNYTIVPARGAYNGIPEESAMVRIVRVFPARTQPKAIFDFCEDIHALLQNICTELRQKKVIVGVTVSSDGEDLRWSRATSVSKDTGQLVDRPFMYSSLLARYLFPDPRPLKLSKLFGNVKRHYMRSPQFAPNRYNRSKVPQVCFPSTKNFEPLPFCSGTQLESAHKQWDNRILKKSPNPPKRRTSRLFHTRSDFISLFYQVSHRPVFYATNLGSLLKGHWPIEARTCKYYESLGCCEGFFSETMDEWFESNGKFTKSFKRLHRVGELRSAQLPSLSVSVLAVTPTRDRRVLTRERSQKLLGYPGMKFLTPAGMVEPFPNYNKPSVVLTVL